MKSLENRESQGLSPYFMIILGLFLLFYIFNLIFGSNSLFALIKTQDKKEELVKEYERLQRENQELQKNYFELIQLTPDIDAF
ncbi:MAG: hypothetical protein GXN91_00595 [Epsilonproteobacteria bacterium]|nr:hypothetical protein [Campylobacterota bacterium]